MNKLTKLTIKKFRNVAPTTLEFRPGLNILLGKNAAGKTTLLRLLSAATGILDKALQDDVLDVSYRAHSASLDFEHTFVRARIAEPILPPGPSRPASKEYFNLSQTDDFALEEKGQIVMRAKVQPNEVVLEKADTPTTVKLELRLDPATSLYVALMKTKGVQEERLATTFSKARIESAGRMDESLDHFHTLLKFEIIREVPQGHWRWNLETVPQSLYSVIEAPVPEGTSAEFRLEFLSRAASVLGYDSATVRFDVEHLIHGPSRKTARLSNPKFFFKRPGEEVSHELLSYGEKRLLSFFAHADASSDVLIADELVNGLHHEWIEACLREIGERQAFLTSQNPLLLDFLRFDSAEEVRRAFILCERISAEAGAQLRWGNPTEDEAESFFSAYQTGIQRVSDILLTKGLW